MSLEDLKDRWQQRREPDGRAPTDEELLETVRERSASFRRRIRRRDLLETAAAVVTAVPFVLLLFSTASTVAKAGGLIVILSAAWIVRTLHRVRLRRADPPRDRTVVEALRAARDRVDDQIDLLERLFWWYLAPPGTGLILVTAGTLGASWSGLAYAVAVVLLGWAVHRLNRRAVRRRLRPRREELTRQIRRLEERGR